MQKTILANHFFKLSKYLFSLLLLVSLTTGLGCTDSGSNSDEMAMTDNTDVTIDNTNVTIEMIRAHVERVGDMDPDIYSKLWQLEDKLSTGMSFQDLCAHCHTDKTNKRT